jgi:hypothetical protein
MSLAFFAALATIIGAKWALLFAVRIVAWRRRAKLAAARDARLRKGQLVEVQRLTGHRPLRIVDTTIRDL